ncbi:MAG: zinc-ribbon domain-containing protein [Pseudomonadota bacterium]
MRRAPSRNALTVMIIACPACATRYAVPETAIGSEGRTVRCAKCKHSWFQEPPPLDLTKTASEPAPTPAPTSAPPAPEPDLEQAPHSAPPAQSDAEPPAVPSINHWKTEDRPSEDIASRALRQGLNQPKEPTVAPKETEPEPAAPDESPDFGETDSGPPAFETESDPLAGQSVESYAALDDTGYDSDEVSRFDYSPPFTARRNPAKMWTAAAAIFALLAIGTIAAVNYYGLPDWAPFNKPTFGVGQPNLELDFPATQQRIETLETGEEIFRVRGAITNSGRETTSVPSLLIVFRDERNKPVGDWLVVPSRGELAPGESLNVTEAIADIPAAANAAEIGWSPN